MEINIDVPLPKLLKHYYNVYERYCTYYIGRLLY